MKEIDARKLECPKPVILTKKELDAMETGVVCTLVDNKVATENLSRLAESMGLKATVEAVGEDYKVTINKDHAVELKSDDETFVIGVGTNIMGHGDEKLGAILIKSFLYTVSQTAPLPKTIVFFNGGVKLTCEGSEVLDDIKSMADNGVKIISCGTCLDFYGLKEKLAVGEISNMYTIYETLEKADRNIVLS